MLSIKSNHCSFTLFSFPSLLKGLEQKLTEALHSILNDDKQGEQVALYSTTAILSSLKGVTCW